MGGGWEGRKEGEKERRREGEGGAFRRRLTNRLHQVHMVHKVPLPQVDGQLGAEHGQSERTPAADPPPPDTHLSAGLSLKHLLVSPGAVCVCECECVCELTFPLGLAFLNTLKENEVL